VTDIKFSVNTSDIEFNACNFVKGKCTGSYLCDYDSQLYKILHEVFQDAISKIRNDKLNTTIRAVSFFASNIIEVHSLLKPCTPHQGPRSLVHMIPHHQTPFYDILVVYLVNVTNL
jgi:hypothetical protein